MNDFVVPASGQLYLAINNYTNGFGNTNTAFTVLVDINPPSACENQGDSSCELGANCGEPATGNPIGIRNGEKRESITDLVVKTPAGDLALMRSYSQAKQSSYQHMGLGWTHNHLNKLSVIAGTPKKLIVTLAGGGEAHFAETAVGSNVFNGTPGNLSSVTFSPGNSQYTLTTPDKTVYLFDSSGNLLSRTWVSGHVWTYTYASNRLTEINDGYGRKLVFAYRPTGAYDANQLWRVGDHTATGLATATPGGRYVEYGYTPEKNNGVTIANPKALLATVRDVRAQVWSYNYYGQTAGESVVAKLNLLTKRLSPTVDVNGDDIPDGALTLEEVDYTLSGSVISAIKQKRGVVNALFSSPLLVTDYAFQPIGQPITTETLAGKITTHRFVNGVHRATIDPAGNPNIRVLNENHRPSEVRDGSLNPTKMAWSANGKLLNKVTNALNQEVNFQYNTGDDTLRDSLDAENIRTNYLYETSQRQPSIVLVSKDTASLTEVNVGGAMENLTDWPAVGTPSRTVSATPCVAGTGSLRVQATAAGQGIQSNTTFQLDAGKTYAIIARVYPVSGQARMLIPGVGGLERLTSTSVGDMQTWQTLRLLHTPATTLTGQRLQFLSVGAADFYVDAVHVIPVTNLLRWQDFLYDDRLRTLDEAVVDTQTALLSQRTQRSYHTSGNGNGLLASLTQIDPVNAANNKSTQYTYDSIGRIIKTQESSLFGDCQSSFTLYDPAGNILASICNYDPGANPDPTTVAAAIALYNPAIPTKNKVTTYVYDALGRRIRTTIHAGASFAQTNLTFYDALDRVIYTIANYVNQSGGTAENVGAWTWNAISKQWEKTNGTAISHGADNTQNIISISRYNQRGQLRLQQDTLGNFTLYGYDDADRLVKTVQNASIPGYNNDSFDLALANYPVGSNPDQDIITSQEFDKAGNVVKSTDAAGMVTFTIFDALNRAVKTIQSPKDAATRDNYPGDLFYAATNDPRSDSYEPDPSPDRDTIQTVAYDSMGRVIRTSRLLDNRPTKLWETTLYGYDPLGRQAVVIANASQPTYNIQADPDLSDYVVSAVADQDIISRNRYDSKGQVLETEDTTGTRTRFVYDGLGRQIRTISNYIPQGSSLPENWVWESNLWKQAAGGTAIVHGALNDQNIVQETIYDVNGRVESTRDTNGRVSRNVYEDPVNRLIRTVTNYVAQGTTDPRNWVWSATNNRWERGASDPTPIVHGTNNDQNIIANTVYDNQGRAAQSSDHRNNVSLRVFDTLGRQTRSIPNYIVQGASAPANWVWDTGAWRQSTGGAVISFGTDNDQNRISVTAYDRVGRVLSTRDVASIETRYEYDLIGRRTRTLTNYVDGLFNPALPDEDLISTTVYDRAGRVITTTDPRGTQTGFTYDRLGRRLTTTQAANTALATAIYTSYDKAGRVLRMIQNWSNDPTKPSPDAKDTSGNWLFNPITVAPDRDLINEQQYDRAGRLTRMIDPMGNVTRTLYFKDGSIRQITDPEQVKTAFAYDRLRRRVQVAQSFKPNPKVAFSTAIAPSLEIYIMNMDGSGQQNLTNNVGNDTQPSFNPEGTEILFASDRAGSSPTFFYDIYLMNVDGTHVRRLSNFGGYANVPVMSPDGSRIAYVFKANGATDSGVYVMNADGTNVQQVYFQAGQSVFKPAWSPDGRQIVFSAGLTSGKTDIYVMQADGTQLVNLTQSAALYNSQQAVWSPDGTRFAFSSDRSGNYDIFVMNANGSNVINLTQPSTGTDVEPFWSPDGRQIYFRSNRNGKDEIFVMNADGSSQTNLTGNLAYSRMPALTSPTSLDRYVWNSTNSRWEDSAGIAIDHGSNNDQNIIVEVSYDRAGRVLNQREPRGNLTAYEYDQLDRRTKLTNPLSIQWLTGFSDLTGGRTRQTMTYPGLGAGSYAVQREFDRLGRLQTIAYGAPATTRDVRFTYDALGNRQKMSEFSAANFTTRVRETTFGYDDLRRLTSVGFDNDGNGTVDETVSYQYDAGGLRTRLTLPGNLNIHYTYDAKGQLVSLTDWDSQTTDLGYDRLGRHVATSRSNGLSSQYDYDRAGRLLSLRHQQRNKLLARFEYMVDKRGNRTGALEQQARQFTVTSTIDQANAAVSYTGTWNLAAPFRTTNQFSARLSATVTGREFRLIVGTGPDHSLFDVYIDGSLWESFDGYAAAIGERAIPIYLDKGGTHTIVLRNRAERARLSTGNTLRFKQIDLLDTVYDTQTLRYTYDVLARLREARYFTGTDLAATPARLYTYAFDRSGNRTQQSLSLNGAAPTVTNYTYNAANQLTSGGSTYDSNGNLTSDGTNSYTWDRANRLLSMGGASYVYDGEGRRVRQTIAAQVNQYLLDVQPGLSVVLSTTQGANVNRYVHGPRGIHAQKDASGAWEWMAQDGLGSVRGVTNNAVDVLETRTNDPFGVALTNTGSRQTPFDFTGELLDGNGLLHLRARNYNPGLAVFTSLDAFEGMVNRPMSLNGYSWVEGNTVNMVDPTGMSLQKAMMANAGLCVAGLNAVDEQKCGCYCDPLSNRYSQYSCQVCNAFISGLASSVDSSEFAYCDGSGSGGQCCGPDATEWLYREMINHRHYAGTTFPISASLPGGGPTWLDAYRNQLLVPGGDIDLINLAIYGLAVDYKRIDFRTLAAGSDILGNVNSPQPNYSCPQTGVVTVCGVCQDSSDYGNFILGAIIHAAGRGRTIATLSGQIFNTFFEPDAGASADNAAVEAGYDFAARGNLNNGTFDRRLFCDAVNGISVNWRDRDVLQHPGCRIPCSSGWPNCNNASNSLPHYNIFVSQTVVGGQPLYPSPFNELVTRGAGFFQGIINRFTNR
ncbi:MAG: PD40 domain-containing protein [Anaerolineae bacterium]|nr:PD40 domain-containing protein [Anaerolineae bacterium]